MHWAHETTVGAQASAIFLPFFEFNKENQELEKPLSYSGLKYENTMLEKDFFEAEKSDRRSLKIELE